MGGNRISALQEPIMDGDVSALKQVLDKYGFATPLLLQKQFIANPDCFEVEPIFTTPLKFCIMRNEPECLRVLLQAGGDPNEGGKEGATLLHKACKKISVDCVKVLLEFGARVYDNDEWGVYPIHVCVAAYGDFDDSLEILNILLNAGSPSDIHLRDNEYGKLPLHYAAYYGNKKMCARLLELGVDIDAKDKSGLTAYQSCERQKKTREFLKSKGCHIPEPVKKTFPPLFPLFPVKNVGNNAVSSENSDTSDGSVVENTTTKTTTATIEYNPGQDRESVHDVSEHTQT